MAEENINNLDEEIEEAEAGEEVNADSAGIDGTDNAEDPTTACGGPPPLSGEAEPDEEVNASPSGEVSASADGEVNASPERGGVAEGDGRVSDEQSSEPGRRFWQKRQKKDKNEEKIEDLTDKLKRQMAEFDNFRKRTEKEKAASYGLGAKNVIEKLLPVVDSFERGLESADASDPFVEGMEKTYKQLMTILEGLGVTPIEALGQPFDPNLHNAVMHVEDEEQGENVVVEEFQKGYMYNDQVVRHSMVKVAN